MATIAKSKHRFPSIMHLAADLKSTISASVIWRLLYHLYVAGFRRAWNPTHPKDSKAIFTYSHKDSLIYYLELVRMAALPVQIKLKCPYFWDTFSVEGLRLL